MAQGSAWVGSRRLLKNLRDVMAVPAAPQERLDKVAKLIAADMVAEVCSIYLRRAGDVLELFATEGLNPGAVHQTRLQFGEGLVGHIAAHARPVALADAQTHPNFVFRPETGEQIYHSLLGAPILRGGRVIGVLVVQNRTRRHYDDEEVEALQTIAMVLAEIVTGSDLLSAEELLPVDGIGLLPLRLDGICVNPGLAMGRAVLHKPPIHVERLVADDPVAELRRFETALAGMHSALDDLLAGSRVAQEGEHGEVLETFRMFAQDRGWLRRIREAIQTGLTAEGAVQMVAGETHSRMGQVTDPYLRERLSDLEDLSNRLLSHLTGDERRTSAADAPEDTVLVARNLGPAELLEYEKANLRAVALEEGSPMAHVAIIARALGVPVVGRVSGLLDKIDTGEPMIVDGDNAQVFVRPGEDVRQTFARSIAAQARRQAAFAALRDLPPETRDGVRVSLNLNAGLLIDLKALDTAGADGIGLYRTEIPFMTRASFPDVDEQARLYAQVLEAAGDRPVVFRTLDVGGDKALPYLRSPADDNPAMGWRALRVALDRPAMLRQQLRGLLRAAAGRELRVMFPMVTEVQEFEAARQLLDLEIARERGLGGELPTRVLAGAMLEVPLLVWQLPALLPRLDFLSVGSNDLLQFLFASDRGNPRLANRYDSLAPPVLAMLRGVASACAKHGVPVTLCGEMAGQPLEAMALVGLGFRSLSMTAASVGAVKAMLRSLNLAALGDYMRDFDNLPDHSLREKLRAFAIDHGVEI